MFVYMYQQYFEFGPIRRKKNNVGQLSKWLPACSLWCHVCKRRSAYLRKSLRRYISKRMRIEIALFCSELSRAFKRFGDFKTNTSSYLFCFEIHQFSNVFNARRLGLFHSVKFLELIKKCLKLCTPLALMGPLMGPGWTWLRKRPLQLVLLVQEGRQTWILTWTSLPVSVE